MNGTRRCNFFYYNRMKRYHSIIKDIKNEAAEQLSVLKRLQHNIDKMKIKDKQTNDFIKTQLSILQEITIACYNEKDSKLNKQVIIVTKSFLRDGSNGEVILDTNKINNINGCVFRIEKKKPFDDKKLGTIQTIISKIK